LSASLPDPRIAPGEFLATRLVASSKSSKDYEKNRRTLGAQPPDPLAAGGFASRPPFAPSDKFWIPDFSSKSAEIPG